MQTVTKLLLLAMFAFAARYAPRNALQGITGTDEAKQRLEAGHEYTLEARRLLSESLRLREVFCDRTLFDSFTVIIMADTVYEDSRPSICQALLLLGLREFGVGSMAQGWMYVGECVNACLQAVGVTSVEQTS